MNIIHSAVVKLTFWYLALILLLSVGFSLVLYRISSTELSLGLRRQGVYFSNPRSLPQGFVSFSNFRDYQLGQELAHLRANLLLFNLTTLVLGGAASYFLALQTLHPIEEAMDSQSRFTADASHELRTPLTAMQTEIEVALRDTGLTKLQAKELLASNLEEVAKLRALSDGLLRLAQQDSKDALSELVELAGVVASAKERLTKAAQVKNITITTEVSAITVAGDYESLVELVSILLDNAIKYSPPASEVVIRLSRHSKIAELQVSDQGQGIKASELPHIFDRFYRADTSRSKQQVPGYGLGLSIAQKIVDLHQGSIEASSTPGQGSSFMVKLPVAEKSESEFRS